MKPKISTKVTGTNIESVLNLLKASPDAITELCGGITEVEGKRPFSPNEWSLIDHVAHLLHCEQISTQAIYQALLQSNSAIVDIHPERQFGKLVQFNQLSLLELTQLFVIKRKLLIQVLNNLTIEKWQHQIIKSNKKPQSVYLLSRSLALHEADHILFLQGNSSKIGEINEQN